MGHYGHVNFQKALIRSIVSYRRSTSALGAITAAAAGAWFSPQPWNGRSLTVQKGGAMSNTYAAFISYTHAEPDRLRAQWLQSAIEKYRVPRKLVREKGLPRRLGRVFRDEEELAASPHLGKNIEAALERSDHLIVVCSPRTPASLWVNAEVDFFRQLRRRDRVYALLIEGTPEESFPTSLCQLHAGPHQSPFGRQEPHAADLRVKPGESARTTERVAKLRVIAALLGCDFDDLRRREQQRRRRNRVVVAVIGAALLFVVGGMAGLTWRSFEAARLADAQATLAKDQARLAEDQARLSDDKRLTEERLREAAEADRRGAEANQRMQESLRDVAEANRLLYRDPTQAVVLARRALQGLQTIGLRTQPSTRRIV